MAWRGAAAAAVPAEARFTGSRGRVGQQVVEYAASVYDYEYDLENEYTYTVIPTRVNQPRLFKSISLIFASLPPPHTAPTTHHPIFFAPPDVTAPLVSF